MAARNPPRFPDFARPFFLADRGTTRSLYLSYDWDNYVIVIGREQAKLSGDIWKSSIFKEFSDIIRIACIHCIPLPIWQKIEQRVKM